MKIIFKFMVATQDNTTAQNELIIPDSVMQNYPDVVELIKQSDSMNLEEKNYWFKIMPMMNAEQIENLRSILFKERQKMTEINAKYSHDLQEINDTHQAEITILEIKQQKEKLQAAESEAEVEESEEEKALLEELAQL